MSDSAPPAYDRARGVRLIAGVDEVGRACLAGPIMAAGVLFDLERLASGPGRNLLDDLNDSKRVAPTKRERRPGPERLSGLHRVGLAVAPQRDQRASACVRGAATLRWASVHECHPRL